MFRVLLPSVVFVALVLAAGVGQGLQNERWRPSADVEAAALRLENVPVTFGNWRSEPVPLADDLTHIGIQGYSSKRYLNNVTGDVVTVLIVCGRPGPISVHTPDVCYGTAGYTAAGDLHLKEIPIAGRKGLSVWAQPFKRPATQSASNIEVNWAWLAGNEWVAPENSRLSFAGYSALYKLYVVRDLPAMASSNKRDSSALFMSEFLPALEKVLAPVQSP
jgi:hypothetical protein